MIISKIIIVRNGTAISWSSSFCFYLSIFAIFNQNPTTRLSGEQHAAVRQPLLNQRLSSQISQPAISRSPWPIASHPPPVPSTVDCRHTNNRLSLLIGFCLRNDFYSRAAGYCCMFEWPSSDLFAEAFSAPVVPWINRQQSQHVHCTLLCPVSSSVDRWRLAAKRSTLERAYQLKVPKAVAILNGPLKCLQCRLRVQYGRE